MRNWLPLLLVLTVCSPLFAQNPSDSLSVTSSRRRTKKLRFYTYWGWNRDWYSDSDIHFKGSDYDFTLNDVQAKDRQSPVDVTTYANPTTLTIPQTNFRLGFYLNNHWDVSFGVEHMKYVMVQDQFVTINGVINGMESDFNGEYIDKPIQLTTDFLKFEHTDGLNYINFELRRSDVMLEFCKHNPERFFVSVTEGLGAGALLPRTNTTLLGNARYDEFHLSGFGFNAVIGLNVTLWEHFFVQGEAVAGYINMPDIRTTQSKSDMASQHFTFFESKFVFGFRFGI
jgi:hypothetical protein